MVKRSPEAPANRESTMTHAIERWQRLAELLG